MIATGRQAEARATAGSRTRPRRPEAAQRDGVVALEVGVLRHALVIEGVVDLVEALTDGNAPYDLVGREGIAGPGFRRGNLDLGEAFVRNGLCPGAARRERINSHT